MANKTKRNDDEQPLPEPEGAAELKLNLTFCSVEELIDELKRRCSAMALVYSYTDKSREIEPDPDSADSQEGGRWYTTAFKGTTPHCMGMLEAVKADLIQSWTNK